MDVPNILSWVTYLPAIAALLLLFIPRVAEKAIKSVALLGSLIAFVFSLHLVVHFDETLGTMQFEESIPWIQTQTFNITGIYIYMIIIYTITQQLHNKVHNGKSRREWTLLYIEIIIIYTIITRL